MKKAKKAYGYARTATVAQAKEPNSIEVQKKLIKEFCKKNNIKLLGIFTDIGKSGLKINPGLAKLLKKTKNGGINAVVIKDVSRLTRSATNYFLIKEQLKKAGIEILNISCPDSAAEELVASVFLSVREFDRDIKRRKRVKSREKALFCNICQKQISKSKREI